MKKYFQFAIVAVAALLMVSCDNKDKKSSDSSSSEAQEEEVAKGTTFEGEKFSIVYPEFLKESYKSDIAVNATNDEEGVKMDATFSDFPCTPEDFTQYYNNYKAPEMFSDYKFEEPQIQDNIMIFKAVNEKAGLAMTNFVVYLDEKAGVAGKMEYPIDKASEIEPLVMPMAKSIKKK